MITSQARPSQLVVAAALLAILSFATTSSAQSIWNGSVSTDWNTAANWDNGTVPVGTGGANDGITNIPGGANPPFSATISDNLSGDDATPRDIRVGNGAGSNGVLNQASGRAVLANGTGNGWAFTGVAGGTGVYNLSGTAFVHSGNFIVGDGNGSVGTVNITDDAFVQVNLEVWVGQGGGAIGGNGTLNMDSGTIESGAWIAVGRDNGTGVVNLTGDARLAKVAGNNNAFITLGGLGNSRGGTINISGNAVLESDTNMVIAENAGRFGIVNQMGGTVNLHNSTNAAFPKSLYVQFATGAGTNGEYHLSGGALNAQTIDAVDGLFDMTGGTLNATLFEGNLAQNGGTLSPGASPGTTTVMGNYALNSGDLAVDLDGLTPGTGHDQVIVSGDVTLAGALTLAVGFTPSLGDSFRIIDNQGANPVTGTFTQGSSISSGGFTFGINYGAGDGNDVVLTVVPEPASVSLIAVTAAVGWGVARRRRHGRPATMGHI
jgi:hypothetical protein